MHKQLVVHIYTMEFYSAMKEFHLYDILEKAKLQGQKSDQWLPVAKEGGEGNFWVTEMFHIPIYMTVYIC